MADDDRPAEEDPDPEFEDKEDTDAPVERSKGVGQLPPHMCAVHLLTHKPALPACPTCIGAKMKRVQCRKKHMPLSTKYKKFGELVTMDYVEARWGFIAPSPTTRSC